MRGYYLGRYRDKNLLAGQIEYRILPFGFSKNGVRAYSLQPVKFMAMT